MCYSGRWGMDDERQRYGAPQDADALEGWIADPTSISTRSGLSGLSDPGGYLRPARCAHSCARCARWLSARGAGSAIQTNHMVPNRICIGFFKASQFAIPLQDAVRIMSAVQDIGRLVLFEHGHFHLTAPAMQHLHHQERPASAASAGYLPDTIRHLRVPVLRAVDARGTIGAAARPPADFLHNI